MKRKRQLILLLAVMVLLFTGCGTAQIGDTSKRQETESAAKVSTLDGMAVHFLDVGQGDATLIQTGGKAMLIDAGENDKEDVVVSYLKDQGIETLDYVVGTHPHSDHIGGLDTVIQNFDVKAVILPDKIHTSRTFEDVLTAIEEKDLGVTIANVNDTYSLGGAEFVIFGPVKDYGDNLNNWSVGVKLIFGSTAFVFSGDAEIQAEKDMCGAGIDLKADVLQVGHHGSVTSSSDEFLQAVQPEFTVFSLGADNRYGHPHKEIVEKFLTADITYFRIDESGTVIANSDGQTITWDKVKSQTIDGGSAIVEEEEAESIEAASAYILNTNTKKIHLPACSSVKQIKPSNYKAVDKKEEMLAQGYQGCKNCNP